MSDDSDFTDELYENFAEESRKKGKSIPKIQPKRKLEVAADSGNDDGIWLTSYADLMTLVACFFILLVAFANFDQQSFSRKATEMSKHFSGNEPNEASSGLMEKLKEELESDPILKSATEIKMEMEGIVINFSGSALFESGKADLRPEITDALDVMIDLIQEKNPSAIIIVEGHTDALPLVNSSKFRNNWELSGARSARVVERFEQFKFKPQNLIAVGYGSTRPLKPNYDDQGFPDFEHMKENRRVIVKVLENPEMLKREKLGLGVYFDDVLIKDGKAEMKVNGQKVVPTKPLESVEPTEPAKPAVPTESTPQ